MTESNSVYLADAIQLIRLLQCCMGTIGRDYRWIINAPSSDCKVKALYTSYGLWEGAQYMRLHNLGDVCLSVYAYIPHTPFGYSPQTNSYTVGTTGKKIIIVISTYADSLLQAVEKRHIRDADVQSY